MDDVGQFPVWLRFAPRPKVAKGVLVEEGVLQKPVVVDPGSPPDPVDVDNNDNWLLAKAQVEVVGRNGGLRAFGIVNRDGDVVEHLNLWLGEDFGLYVYLREVSVAGP